MNKPLRSAINLAKRVVPERYRAQPYLEDLIRRKTQHVVQQGPFAGMRYIPGAISSVYLPKLLGIYERELYPVIDYVIGRKFGTIIDIGAAEGYYAVGLARRLPGARIIAYEMDAEGQRMLSSMVALNNVQRQIEIRGMCEPDDLQADLHRTDEALVICDTEGYETRLMDPEAVPALEAAHILVESHDFIRRGITETLKERFAPTHSVQQIWQEGRGLMDMPFRTMYTRILPNRYIHWAVKEHRPERMCWLWMQPTGG